MMKYRTLPGTVSKPLRGLPRHDEWATDTKRRARALDYAFRMASLSIPPNYPVPPMNPQGTEAFLVNWLAKRKPAVRHATKWATGSARWTWRQGRSHARRHGEAVATILAGSSRCIDLYQIHWPQRNVPMFGAKEFEPAKERSGPSIEEQVEGLAAMIKAGKIRHYGLSNETAWGVCEFRRVAKKLRVPGPVTIQNSYSLVSRGVDNDLAEVLFREKMSLLAYRPLAGGMLSGKYMGGAQPPNSRFTLFDGIGVRFRKPIVHEAVEAYAALAQRRGLSLMQLAWAIKSRRYLAHRRRRNLQSQLAEDIAAAQSSSRRDPRAIAALQVRFRSAG